MDCQSQPTRTRRRYVRPITLGLFLLVALCGGPQSSAQTPPVSGTIHPYVGGGNGDGGPAANAIIDPRGTWPVANAAGAPDLYIADLFNSRVRRISASTGTIDTVAGTGTRGYSGDGGPAVNAMLNWPNDVAVDGTGNVYIADTFNNRVRRVDNSGKITTYAGIGVGTYSGDGGPAALAGINNPYGVAVDAAGNLFIADLGNNCIRKVSVNGTITTVAGTGDRGFSGDGGPATSATFANPGDVVVAADGTLYVADYQNQRIRKIDPGGIISTVAGNGTGGYAGDGGPATSAWLNSPYQVAIDGAQNIYVADTRNDRVRRVDALSQTISTVTGNGTSGDSGDGGPAAQALIYPPYGVASYAGGIYVAVGNNQAQSPHNRIRFVDAGGTMGTVVGGGVGDGGPAINAQVSPRGGTTRPTANGNPTLYFADGTTNRVRRVDGDTGDIFTVAGNGVAGYAGDGGQALNAKLNSPLDVAVDNAGVVYIADTLNNVVRRVSLSGVITTIAGSGGWGYSGDGGSATQALLAYPYGVSVDTAGNVLIADFSNNRIRRVTPSGLIQTVAGNGQWGFNGDGGAATAAQLKNPTDVVATADGSFYIAEYLGNRVRRVDPQGTISTVVGTGLAGFMGDGGSALAARLNQPFQLAFDGAGNMFIADLGNKRVRRVDTPTGTIDTVAGNGQVGVQGDGGPAVLANLSAPNGISIDSAGSALFISVPDDARVRVVLLNTPGTNSTATPTPPATLPPTPSPTATKTPTPSLTATPIPTSTSAWTPTLTPTSTQTPSASPTRTLTASRTATSTSTSTPTRTPTRTLTSVATATPTITPQSLTVAGRIQYFSNAMPVSNAAVQLQSTDPGGGGAAAAVATDAQGWFAFASVGGGNWMVEPQKTGDATAAINALDAVHALEAAVGMRALDTEHAIACDVTGDGAVTALDAVYILQYAVGMVGSFPVAQSCGSDWAFMPLPDPVANQEVMAPQTSGPSCQGGAIAFQPLLGPATNQNFAAILFGDCAGDWQPRGGGSAALTTAAGSATTVRLGTWRRRGHTIQVPLYVEPAAAFRSLDLTLQYDAEHLAAPRVRRAAATQHALLAVNAQHAGVVRLSLASSAPLTGGRVLQLEFHTTSRHVAAAALHVLHAIVGTD